MCERANVKSEMSVISGRLEGIQSYESVAPVFSEDSRVNLLTPVHLAE